MDQLSRGIVAIAIVVAASCAQAETDIPLSTSGIVNRLVDPPRIRIDPNSTPNAVPKERGQDGRFRPRDDGVKRELVRDNKINAANGGELTADLANVNIDQHGVCRWVDNNDDANNYFIPTGSAEEWTAFVANAPSSVRIDKCCPAKNVVLTASDGQTYSVALDIGRENSTGQFGTRTLSHSFRLYRPSDKQSWTETVTATYVCQGEAWQQQGSDITGAPPAEAAIDPCAPVATPVVATWAGYLKRTSKSNATYSNSGFSGVGNVCTTSPESMLASGCNGSDNSAAVFGLTLPARDTHVKITAEYDAWGPFNGAPVSAEFDIAAAQTLLGGAGNVFYVPGRKGHPFMMDNNSILMPAYDTRPALRSVRVEYNAMLPPAACLLPPSTSPASSSCIPIGGGCGQGADGVAFCWPDIMWCPTEAERAAFQTQR